MAWVVMYRHGNVKRRLTLGTYPALSLADAREQAGRALRAVQYDGADPATNKKADRAAETFEELAQEYLERHAKREKQAGPEPEAQCEDMQNASEHSQPR